MRSIEYFAPKAGARFGAQYPRRSTSRARAASFGWSPHARNCPGERVLQEESHGDRPDGVCEQAFRNPVEECQHGHERDGAVEDEQRYVIVEPCQDEVTVDAENRQERQVERERRRGQLKIDGDWLLLDPGRVEASQAQHDGADDEHDRQFRKRLRDPPSFRPKLMMVPNAISETRLTPTVYTIISARLHGAMPASRSNRKPETSERQRKASPPRRIGSWGPTYSTPTTASRAT